MRKFTFVFTLLLVSSMLAFSQKEPRRSAEDRATMFTKNLTKELALNEEQSSKIRIIQLEAIQKVDAIRAKGMESGDRKTMRQEVKLINDTADTEITAFLTADQKIKFEAWKVKRIEEMRNRGPKGANNRKR